MWPGESGGYLVVAAVALMIEGTISTCECLYLPLTVHFGTDEFVYGYNGCFPHAHLPSGTKGLKTIEMACAAVGVGCL